MPSRDGYTTGLWFVGGILLSSEIQELLVWDLILLKDMRFPGGLWDSVILPDILAESVGLWEPAKSSSCLTSWNNKNNHPRLAEKTTLVSLWVYLHLTFQANKTGRKFKGCGSMWTKIFRNVISPTWGNWQVLFSSNYLYHRCPQLPLHHLLN